MVMGSNRLEKFEVTEKGVSKSKEDGIRLAKFSVLVDEIYDSIIVEYGGYLGLGAMFFARHNISLKDFEYRYDQKYIDRSLMFIFDYEKLNSFAHIILEKCPIATEWNEKKFQREYSCGEENFYDNIENMIRDTKSFVEACRDPHYVSEGYKFIFWSLMILAVDKSNEDEHISLICNFAKMLHITDQEIADMIYVVKLIFNKVDSSYDFQSDTVVQIFGNILNKYNCEV